MKKPPTQKQLDTLRYIADYHREHGWMPTLKEIGGHFGVQTRAVFDRLFALDRKGLIVLKGYIVLRLTDRGRELLLPEMAYTIPEDGIVDDPNNVLEVYQKVLIGGI